MSFKTNKIFQVLFILIFSLTQINVMNAQNKKGPRGAKGGKMMVGEIFGQVIDQSSKQPMEYATVSLFNAKSNDLINGTITEADGKFSITKIPGGIYNLKISFIGYTDLEIKDIKINKSKSVYNTKKLKMTASVLLDEVIIDGTTPIIRYEIDKKVVDVSNLNTDLSQSAVEILENLPSITLNDDGEITLRGSGSFTLLIDGKPTAMDATEAMTTIPASLIKNIEIITNPSAKYDAEGVSGIINIVLKQNKLKGASLLANLSAGTFENYGGDIAASYRTDKFGFNASASHNNRARPTDKEVTRTRLVDNQLSEIKSIEDLDRNFQSTALKGDFVYEPNSAHSFTLGGVYRLFDMNNDNILNYSLYRDNILTDNYSNHEYGLRDFISTNLNLNYRYNVQRNKEHYFEFKATRSERGGNEFLTTDYLDNTGKIFDGTRRTEDGPSIVYRFNADYSKKFGKSKFETGLQYQNGLSEDDSDAYNYDPLLEEYVIEPQFSKDVEYVRNISAAYALFGSQHKKLGYQVGLRVEHTDRNITATGSEKFTKIDRFDWFPSAHFSYKLSDNQELLVNYSRRINRPRSYWFEPFLTWNHAYSVSSGNPELQPEYINAYEVNWLYKLGRRGNVGLEVYYRDVENHIERIQTQYEDDILFTQPYNIGRAASLGVQPSLNYKVKKWWKTDLSFNLYQYHISGDFNGEDYDKNSLTWSGRWTNTFPFKNSWQLQVSANYSGKETQVQGYRLGFYMVNASIKKSFLEKKYSLTLQSRDVFGTRRNENFFSTNGLEVHSIRKPKTPQITMTFSMRLNNYKQFKKQDEIEDI